MHHLFNIITNGKDIPHAVLIRAIQPIHGIEKMLERRKKKSIQRSLTAGPAALSQALGIRCEHSGLSVLGKEIWLEHHGIIFSPEQIIASPRVGVHYAGTDAKLPWRFRIRENLWTSKAK
jgi:DNA-3-methyladenine glycosylase